MLYMQSMKCRHGLYCRLQCVGLEGGARGYVYMSSVLFANGFLGVGYECASGAWGGSERTARALAASWAVSKGGSGVGRGNMSRKL